MTMRTTGGHYPQSLDNGVLDKAANGPRLNTKFAKVLANGENPNGLMVQTPNGTSRQDHRQCCPDYNMDTDPWTKNEPWDGDMSGN